MPTRADAVNIVFLEEGAPLGEFEFNIARQKENSAHYFIICIGWLIQASAALTVLVPASLFSHVSVTLPAYSTFPSLLTHHTVSPPFDFAYA